MTLIIVSPMKFCVGTLLTGRHYLLRTQDRTLWVTVLEHGYGYVMVTLKGLELQETSCHTTEATRIEENFESAFETSTARVNRYITDSLTPCTAEYVQCYSDAKNQLTGIIDSPDTQQAISQNFIKVFTN